MKPSSNEILKRCDKLQNDADFQAFLDESDTDDDIDGLVRPSPMQDTHASSARETGHDARLPRAKLGFNSNASMPSQVANFETGEKKSRLESTYDDTTSASKHSKETKNVSSLQHIMDANNLKFEAGDTLEVSPENSYGGTKSCHDRSSVGSEHDEVHGSDSLVHSFGHSQEDIVNISVYTLGGNAAGNLRLHSSSVVRDIKFHLWTTKGLFIASQVLMLGSVVLTDDMPICRYGMDGDVELQLACVEVNEESDCIKTVVHCQPIRETHAEAADRLSASINSDQKEVVIHKPGDATYSKTFKFDAVFDGSCPQQVVFDSVGHPLMEEFIAGFSSTILAYGATKSCKSQTMFGERLDCLPCWLHWEQGLVARSLIHLFAVLEKMPGMKANVHCRFLAIQNEIIFDLLSERPFTARPVLKDHPNGVYAKGAISQTVDTVHDALSVLRDGLAKAHDISEVPMGSHPIRSQNTHAIFTITLETTCLSNQVCTRMFHLVDVASADMKSLSLSALGNLICALTEKRGSQKRGPSGYLPYRDSKLTRLLQDSLGGTAKTAFIGHIDPTDYDGSLSTLRYTHRAGLVKNKPRIHVHSQSLCNSSAESEREFTRA